MRRVVILAAVLMGCPGPSKSADAGPSDGGLTDAGTFDAGPCITSVLDLDALTPWVLEAPDAGATRTQTLSLRAGCYQRLELRGPARWDEPPGLAATARADTYCDLLGGDGGLELQFWFVTAHADDGGITPLIVDLVSPVDATVSVLGTGLPMRAGLSSTPQPLEPGVPFSEFLWYETQALYEVAADSEGVTVQGSSPEPITLEATRASDRKVFTSGLESTAASVTVPLTASDAVTVHLDLIPRLCHGEQVVFAPSAGALLPAMTTPLTILATQH